MQNFSLLCGIYGIVNISPENKWVEISVLYAKEICVLRQWDLVWPIWSGSIVSAQDSSTWNNQFWLENYCGLEKTTKILKGSFNYSSIQQYFNLKSWIFSLCNQVAKESADVVILDDKFQTIVVVAKWGRSVYSNIQKFVQFQLTVNLVALVINFSSACITGKSLQSYS